MKWWASYVVRGNEHVMGPYESRRRAYRTADGYLPRHIHWIVTGRGETGPWLDVKREFRLLVRRAGA